jgi:hypothetical protein
MERLNDDWFSHCWFCPLIIKEEINALNLFRNNPLDLPALLPIRFFYSWFIKKSVYVRQLLSQYPVRAANCKSQILSGSFCIIA